MPTQLDEHWNSATWPQRYMLASYYVNAILRNKNPSDGRTHWTQRDVTLFMRWIQRHATTISEPIILYRGGTSNMNSMLTLTSATKSLNIAKEFSRNNGYIHVLHLQPNCRIFDMQPYYTNWFHGLGREREVLLLPGHTFEKLKSRGRRIHWNVIAKPKYF